MMDELDRKIIDELQRDFPIAEEPYEIIAKRTGISVDEFMDRVEALTGDGVIRRIGVSLDSRRFGCSSTLAAIRVPQSDIDKACEVIDSLPEVTHSYLRGDEFNIWFTIIAPSEERLKQTIEHIRTTLNLAESDVLDLPVMKLFKLDARFKAAK